MKLLCSLFILTVFRRVRANVEQDGLIDIRDLFSVPGDHARLPETSEDQLAQKQFESRIWSASYPALYSDELSACSILGARAVEEPCEIITGVVLSGDTCNPAECGSHRGVRCALKEPGGSCQQTGMGSRQTQHVCKGCLCVLKDEYKGPGNR